VTPSPATPVFGQAVNYTVIVTDTPPSGFTPTGNVTFSGR